MVEVLDWTAAALDRVDRPAFFARFREGEAVPYFYEPFLEAFDPELRKQLGVWYTPPEVVRYMVARVDKALKDDLDIPDGLAAENVYVLGPVLRHRSLSGGGAAPYHGQSGKSGLGRAHRRKGQAGGNRARVLASRSCPRLFVVAHLQVGLTMQDLDAPLDRRTGTDRAGIFPYQCAHRVGNRE